MSNEQPSIKGNYSPKKSILETLKLATTSFDLLSNEEREKHNLVLNTFEKIATNNMLKSMKTIIDITADELDMTPSEITEILDKYYTEENEDNAPNP